MVPVTVMNKKINLYYMALRFFRARKFIVQYINTLRDWIFYFDFISLNFDTLICYATPFEFKYQVPAGP